MDLMAARRKFFTLGISERGTIKDSWGKIGENIANGLYSTKYSVGGTKELDLGSEGKILMEIAGFDIDTKSSGGTAPITWVAKELLLTDVAMNNPDTTVGGYPNTNIMHPYLAENGAIWNKLPNAVKGLIQAVNKTSYENATNTDLISSEKLWLPSVREVFGDKGYETTGPIYSLIFPDNASRVRCKVNSTSPLIYWTRSVFAGSSTHYATVFFNGGAIYNNRTNYASVLCLCFCT